MMMIIIIIIIIISNRVQAIPGLFHLFWVSVSPPAIPW